MISQQQPSRALKLLSILLCVYFVAVLSLLFIGQLILTDCYYQQQAPDNIYLLAFVAATLGILLALAIKLDRIDEEASVRLIRKLCFAQAGFLLFQFVWLHYLWFIPASESTSCFTGAYDLATGAPVQTPLFFRIYPHNAPTTLLTSYVIRVALLAGMDPRILFPCVGALILNLTTFLLNLTVYRLTQKPIMLWISFALSNVWIGLSQYMLIPYSDIYCVLFPVLAVWVLTCRIREPFKWFFFSLVCFFGYALRPTVLIVWIAYALYRVLLAVQSGWKREALAQKGKKAALAVLACLLAYAPVQLWKDASVVALTGEKNPPETFTVTHYMMMGANYKTYGEFSLADNQFSASFASIAERQAANLEVIKERLAGLSFRHAVKFALVKLYKPHADGNFAADNCGVAYEPERTDPVSQFMRGVFRVDGENHRYYKAMQQILWLTVLCLGCYAALTARRQPAMIHVLGLSVIGMAAYNMMGENWTRYLFVFAPLYLLLAMLGLSRLSADIQEKHRRQRA